MSRKRYNKLRRRNKELKLPEWRYLAGHAEKLVKSLAPEQLIAQRAAHLVSGSAPGLDSDAWAEIPF